VLLARESRWTNNCRYHILYDASKWSSLGCIVTSSTFLSDWTSAVGADRHYLTGESLAEQAKEEASRRVKPMSNPVEAYYHTRDSGDLLDSEKETEQKCRSSVSQSG
jgi:hypothetical protein